MIKIKKHANTHEMYEVDNSWVVPYNPLLSLKYDSHINVEIVHSVTSVKYLFKYLMKGPDRVVVRLANGQEQDITNDEIQRFHDARYISSSEAYWRIFEFPIQKKYPPVTKLLRHLENEQTVLFNDANEAREDVQAGPPATK